MIVNGGSPMPHASRVKQPEPMIPISPDKAQPVASAVILTLIIDREAIVGRLRLFRVISPWASQCTLRYNLPGISKRIKNTTSRAQYCYQTPNLWTAAAPKAAQHRQVRYLLWSLVGSGRDDRPAKAFSYRGRSESSLISYRPRVTCCSPPCRGYPLSLPPISFNAT